MLDQTSQPIHPSGQHAKEALACTWTSCGKAQGIECTRIGSAFACAANVCLYAGETTQTRVPFLGHMAMCGPLGHMRKLRRTLTQLQCVAMHLLGHSIQDMHARDAGPLTVQRRL